MNIKFLEKLPRKLFKQIRLSINRVSPFRKSHTVEEYWNEHTVNSIPFTSATDSENYLEWRFQQYPLFREFMDLWGNHDEEVVLDYGCGPGNDLTGFLLYTKARKVIGVDVSDKALALAKGRLALHKIPEHRIQFIRVSDNSPTIPISNEHVDYIYCEGVLHHTSHPADILKEFRRIIKPQGRACIMVYNRDSLWFHLYTAYSRMILEGAFHGLSAEQAFARNTDGENCPLARCYRSGEWVEICKQAGFTANFVGGYFSEYELKLFGELHTRAISDMRLPREHREFLTALTTDDRGFPLYQGKHAGIGAVYQLTVRP